MNGDVGIAQREKFRPDRGDHLIGIDDRWPGRRRGGHAYSNVSVSESVVLMVFSMCVCMKHCCMLALC